MNPNTDPPSVPENPDIRFEPSVRRVGDYHLGQMIGSGGMGSVYLARQISLRRLVALKILREDYSSDPVYMERFFQEVRMQAKLEHPCIVQAIDAGVEKGVSYFAMEYVNGCDLKTELRIRKRLDESEVLSAARDVAGAMTYAWNRYKMIHRDIKPANIMRTANGTIRLLDLGISKQVSSASAGDAGNTGELTRTGVMIGSPIYISIEQARGNRDIDFRADIYSLGVTMFHLLAGRPPYDSPNSMEVVAMHFNSPIPDLKKLRPGVSSETARLIRWMMEKKPEDRPGSWEIVSKQCEAILAQLEAKREAASRKEKKAGGLRKACGRLVPALILLLLLLSGISAYFLLRKTKETAADGGKKDMPAVPAARTDQTVPSVTERGIPPEEADRMREKELNELLRLSGEKESRQDYDGAIRIWMKYIPPEQLRDDEILRQKIETQLEYLRKARQRHEDETRL